jgi:hypothetical protein
MSGERAPKFVKVARNCRAHDILQQLAELTQFAPMTRTKAFQTDTKS